MTDAPTMRDLILGDKLGEGTLSEVFRAEQVSLQRPVAVKFLKASVSPGSQLGQRFEREACLLATLAHQNIPQVYAVGTAGESRPYMVMELVEGWSLAAVRAKAGPKGFPSDVASIVALKLARALEYIHLRGILHRDLKPGNVLVSRRGDVKLADFGLARAVDEHGTEPSGAVGTPAYMSPEQVLGDRLDDRSDVFSFGIVFYELLTGRRPFEEEAARTVMQKIRLDRYTPARRVRRDVPPTLERILARCLEKNPKHRYPSTGGLCDDLNEHLARAGVLSHEARLVAWLREIGLLDAQGVRTALGPMAAAWLKPSHGPHPLRATIAGQVIASVALMGALGATELLRGREQEPTSALGPRPVGTAGVGTLRVLARPWAEVLVDGYAVDTTPTARGISLAPGTHLVRLRNPAYITEDRSVQVSPNATVWIDVDLRPASGSADHAP